MENKANEVISTTEDIGNNEETETQIETLLKKLNSDVQDNRIMTTQVDRDLMQFNKFIKEQVTPRFNSMIGELNYLRKFNKVLFILAVIEAIAILRLYNGS